MVKKNKNIVDLKFEYWVFGMILVCLSWTHVFISGFAMGYCTLGLILSLQNKLNIVKE